MTAESGNKLRGRVPERFDEFTFEIPNPFPKYAPAFKFPVTFRFDKIPTLVIFGWAAPVTVWAVPTVPRTFDAFKFDRPYPFPVYAFAFRVPETDKDVNCPTDVMLG